PARPPHVFPSEGRVIFIIRPRVAVWTARGISDYHNVISDSKRVSLHAGLRKLASGGSLDGPLLHFSLLIRSLDEKERMRRAVRDLYDFSLESNSLVDVIGGSERVVGVGHHTRRQYSGC